MNTNKIKTLLKQIEDSTVITVDDSPLLNFSFIEEITGEPNSEVLTFSWQDGDYVFDVVFTEESLDAAEVKDNVITAKNTDGEISNIRLYNLAENPVAKVW